MARSTTHRITLFSVVACAMLWAGAAQALKLGNYSGTTADGHSITFTVGKDPSTGKAELTYLTIGFTANCPVSGIPYSVSYGFGFADGHDFDAGRLTWIDSDDPFLYFHVNFVINSSTVVGGNTTTRVPEMILGDPPTKTQLCVSPKQAFRATYQGPAAQQPTRETTTMRILK